MGRNLGAGVAGVVIAMLAVWLVQFVGHAVYTPPAGLDPKNLEAMQAYVATLPLGAFLFVIVAGAWLGTMCERTSPGNDA